MLFVFDAFAAHSKPATTSSMLPNPKWCVIIGFTSISPSSSSSMAVGYWNNTECYHKNLPSLLFSGIKTCKQQTKSLMKTILISMCKPCLAAWACRWSIWKKILRCLLIDVISENFSVSSWGGPHCIGVSEAALYVGFFCHQCVHWKGTAVSSHACMMWSSSCLWCTNAYFGNSGQRLETDTCFLYQIEDSLLENYP